MTHVGSTHTFGGSIKDAEALTIVGVQLSPISAKTMEDVDKNIDMELDWMQKAAVGYPGLDIIVFGECGIQGYHPTKFKDCLLEADLESDEHFARLADKCKELKIWGVFNPLRKHPEHGKQNPYNTAVIVNPEGEIVHTYNKVNPWIPGETNYPGSEIPVTEGPKGSRLATIICADGDYPETWREAAFNGANVIIRTSNWMVPWEDAWKLTNRAGAYQNQVYVVGVNNGGADQKYSYIGRSMVVGPDGAVEVEAPQNVPWMLKANIYPSIVDHLRRQQVTDNFLWQLKHRGASTAGLPDGDTECPYRCYRDWSSEPVMPPEESEEE